MKIECRRCGHNWATRSEKLPKVCPKCRREDYLTSSPESPSLEYQKEVEKPGVNNEIMASVDHQNKVEQAPEPERAKRRLFSRKKKEEPVKVEVAEDVPKAKKEKKPRKRREQLFSEKHPGAYGMLTALGPRMHTITFGLVFIYFALKEILVGNFLFLLDWAQKAPVIGVVMDGIDIYGPEEFLKAYWPLLVAIVASILVTLYILHKVLWRYFFKDYYVEIVDKWGGTGLTLSRDGRLYWYSNNFWHRFWDGIYASPERKTRKLWIHQRGKWFNIFNPPASVITVTIGEDEWLEARGVYGIIGHEKPMRHRIGRQEYTTLVTEFTTNAVPIEQARGVFDKANDRLVAETRKLTQGNAALRLEQMRDGGFVLSQKVRELINDEKQREAKDAEPAAGSDS